MGYFKDPRDSRNARYLCTLWIPKIISTAKIQYIPAIRNKYFKNSYDFGLLKCPEILKILPPVQRFSKSLYFWDFRDSHYSKRLEELKDPEILKIIPMNQRFPRFFTF